MSPEALRQYLEFYKDLGIKSVYRRGGAAHPQPSQPEPAVALSAPVPTAVHLPQPPVPEPPMQLPPLAPEGDTVLKILQDIGDCRRCRLHAGRTKIVFGVGNEQAPLVFVGEGPGADEDAQGIPFVGRARQLLTQMIENT